MSLSNLETVKKLYQFIAKDDFENANKMMADNVVFSESEDLPYGGEYHGVAGLDTLMGKIAEKVKLSVASVEIISDTPNANPVVVHVVARFTPHSGADELLMDIVELAKVNDGKIEAMDIYCKAPSKIAAFWES